MMTNPYVDIGIFSVAFLIVYWSFRLTFRYMDDPNEEIEEEKKIKVIGEIPIDTFKVYNPRKDEKAILENKTTETYFD